MRKNVLVIEHDPLQRNQLCTLLEERKFSCDQAATLDEAITLLEANDYQLLMLDLMLPDENGFRALDVIRERFPEQAKHTIVMTHADPKFIEKLPSDGWCAVLLKPCTPEQLYNTVDHCLGDDHAAGFAYH